MIRPAELEAIRAGTVDVAFRRWDWARLLVGTRMRIPVGLVEVTSVTRVDPELLLDDDARRAGATSLTALLAAVAAHPDRPLYRVGLRHAGPDPRTALRGSAPSAGEVEEIRSRLARLDRASSSGPWTARTLAVIDRSPQVRAPDLASELGRETVAFKRDVRKLKELGLTESLDIGYRLSPRGAAVVDATLPKARRTYRTPPSLTPLPSVGAPATRALAAAGLTSVEAVAAIPDTEMAALHGVGPVALTRLRAAIGREGPTLRFHDREGSGPSQPPILSGS